jgi:hypothetical protein
MNKSLIAVVGVAVALAVGASLAQEAKAPEEAPKATQPASVTDTKVQMARMDEHMKKMQALHDKMMSAATVEERQKAMDEARNEMQDSMATMQPMMHGGGMMGGGMGQKGRTGDANAQMQMMGKRMDMMQMMMDQQEMMGDSKPAAAAKK